ncbi:MAG: NAD(P)-dependent oxidoreductase [Eubacteriales bacterium]|nr:NAD(P)-dependent oxidoreductase [Eubacteriales bacterium]
MYKSNSVWITGASGRMGSAIKRILKKKTDYKVMATGKEVDITDMQAVEQAFDIYKPNVIINCASISNADYCEENMVEAFKVNALGARNLAVVSMQHNVKIIHLSTDDVFSGENNRAKNEFDIPTPKTVYGKSKFAGENFVRELNPKHLIIRSSWVYGTDKDGDYVKFVLDKAKAGESFEVPVDRVSSPTSADRVAKFIVEMIPKKEYGIYHVSGEGVCTRYQMATAILSAAGYDTSLAVASAGANDSAMVTTLLDNLMLKITGLYEMPAWEEDLEKYVKGLKK